jgi:hypothetical protein
LSFYLHATRKRKWSLARRLGPNASLLHRSDDLFFSKLEEVAEYLLGGLLPSFGGPVVRGFLKHFAPDEFRPDEISILEDAFENAWYRIVGSKAPWASDDYSTAGRTIMAKYIIAMAKGGERDAKWLADSAVIYLSQQKLCRKPPEVI